jgi:uncharacterized protein YndB with AHSA1/START domain
MGRTIVVEQHVPAPPDAVFARWTTSDALSGWWWPHIGDTTYRIDAVAGGSYEIRSEAAGIGVTGDVVEVAPPSRLRLTWRWLNDGIPEPEEPVEVTFEPDGEGTLVTVQHVLDDTADQGDGIQQGWESVLGRLAALP